MERALIAWGRKSQPPHYSNRFECYPQNYMIFIQQGMLRVVDCDEHAGERSRVIERGQCLILPYASAFTLSTTETGYRGHFVDIPTANDDAIWLPKVQVHRQSSAVMQAIHSIEDEMQMQGDLAMIPALYEVLYWQMRRDSLAVNEDRAIVNRISALLSAHCYTDDSLSGILASIPYGERHLRRLYKQRHGTSIKSALQSLKIQEAQRLLRGTDLSITNIAFSLGFPSSQHFASSFKRQTGATPRKYRHLK